jgi:hypothetical protein
MRSKFLSTLALTATLAAFPAALEAAPDQTLGMAVLGAVLNSGGSIIGQFSSGAVSAAKIATGVYTVTFNRSLSGCTPMVAAFTPNRTATFEGPSPDGDSWTVRTRDLDGFPADSQITILNFCSR